MKRLLIVIAILIVCGAAALALLSRTDPSPGVAAAIAGAPASAAAVARGEYLMKAADCVACHTVGETGKPFAGGVAFKLPFGTIYSTNITADPTYGIGAYTDEEFVRAVRDGIRRDGKHLYPAFPYTSYTQLSRDDVLAIKAYLWTLPPVAQPNRAERAWISVQSAVGHDVLERGVLQERAFRRRSQSSRHNGTAVLILPPRSATAASATRRAISASDSSTAASSPARNCKAGAPTTSPPIRSMESARGRTIRSSPISHRVTHPRMPRPADPCSRRSSHSLQFLDPADAAALVAYLRTVPAHEGKHPISVDAAPPAVVASNAMLPGPDELASESQGLALFEGACAGCHQWNGSGRQTPYASLQGTRSVNDPSAKNVTQAILEGAKMRIGETDVYMPAFDTYSNAEVAALANYVVAHFGGKHAGITADDVAARRKF